MPPLMPAEAMPRLRDGMAVATESAVAWPPHSTPLVKIVLLGVSGAVTSDLARRLHQTNVRSHVKSADVIVSILINVYLETWDDMLAKRFEVVKTHDLVVGANLSRYEKKAEICTNLHANCTNVASH